MGSTLAPRLLLTCALAVAAGGPLSAQSGRGSTIAVDVRLGGAGEQVDSSAPRPVRRLDAAAPPAVLPPAVVHRAPFPLAEVASEPMLTVAEGAVRSEAVLPVRSRSAPPPEGTRVQLWRPGSGEEAGPLGWPVATATMTASSSLRLDRLYAPVQAGDRVRLLPAEPDLAGRRLEAVAAGRRAAVVDLLSRRPLSQIGDWVRIAAGDDAAIRPGDEFVPVAGPADLHSETRLQVVSVHPSQSVARILQLGTTTLHPGVTVRLDRRVR